LGAAGTRAQRSRGVGRGTRAAQGKVEIRPLQPGADRMRSADRRGPLQPTRAHGL